MEEPKRRRSSGNKERKSGSSRGGEERSSSSSRKSRRRSAGEATSQSSSGLRRTLSDERRPRSAKAEKSGVMRQPSFLQQLESRCRSAQTRSSFEIDAPRTPLKNRISDAVSVATEDMGLTDEQRAWAGIDAVLDDNESIATRDVLPAAVIAAMHMSFNTAAQSSFHAQSPTPARHRRSVGLESKDGTTDTDSETEEEPEDTMPDLLESSFSSLQTTETLSSLVSRANNVVVQGGSAASSSMHRYFGSILDPKTEEDEDEDDDDDSIDASQLIHQYTAPKQPPNRQAPARTVTGASENMPELAQSSFSSIQTDGGLSLVSAARNYVVQKSANPMAGFLNGLSDQPSPPPPARAPKSESAKERALKSAPPSADDLSVYEAPPPAAEELSVYEQSQAPGEDDLSQGENDSQELNFTPQYLLPRFTAEQLKQQSEGIFVPNDSFFNGSDCPEPSSVAYSTTEAEESFDPEDLIEARPDQVQIQQPEEYYDDDEGYDDYDPNYHDIEIDEDVEEEEDEYGFEEDQFEKPHPAYEEELNMSMVFFMQSISRNLERKKRASQLESEEERVEQMYRRDPVADMQRHMRASAGGPDFDEMSMPSLASIRESEVSGSSHPCAMRSPGGFLDAWDAFGPTGNSAAQLAEAPKPRRKVRKVKKTRKKAPTPRKPKPVAVEPPKAESPDGFEDYFGNADEVISMSPLSVPRKSGSLGTFDLNTPKAANKKTIRDNHKKKDKYKDTKSPLSAFKNKMGSLFGKNRRCSPTSVMSVGGRGEAQFFPSTIEEEEDEDWGGLLS